MEAWGTRTWRPPLGGPVCARDHRVDDAAARDCRHLEGRATPADDVTDDRRTAELREHKAADGLDLRVLERNAERIAARTSLSGIVIGTYGSGRASFAVTGRFAM